LLAEHGVRERSGVLTAVRGKLKRLFCLRQGALVFAASNVVEEQFAHFLLTHGKIDTGQLAEARSRAAAEGLKLAPALEAAGALDAAALQNAMGEQVRELLESTLEWPDGELSFEPGQPALDGEPLANVSAVRVVLQHAGRFPAKTDKLRTAVGRPGTRLELCPEKSALVQGLDGPAIGYVLGSCDGERTIGEILSESPVGEDAALRNLWALSRLGVIQPVGAGRARATSAQPVEAPVPREELLERAARADGADHYTVLGLTRTATRSAVRTAYYALARRLHPDRFRAGDLSDLLETIEDYFAKVTEAYNTLYDPDTKRAYDLSLDEGKRKEDEETAESDASFLARQNYLRGKALVEKKRLRDGMRFLENAVRLDQTQPEYYLTLGLLQAQNPRFRDQAEENLLAVTRLEPTATRAYLALGDLYARAERREEAEQMYREVLRWSPDNTTANERLIELGIKPGKGIFGG
jgi:tetratricopeptide (TPR) repeat protein